MGKIICINRESLQECDVFTATAQDFVGDTVRAFSWPFFQPKWPFISLFNMWQGTHTGMIVRYRGELCACEMAPSVRRLRFANTTVKEVISPDEFNALSEKEKQLWKPVVLETGLCMTPLESYENTILQSHFCFVGRHDAFNNSAFRQFATAYMQDEYEHGERYDWDEILKQLLPFEKRDPNKAICSRWNYDVFSKCKITMPKAWDDSVTPADWQQWKELKEVNWKLNY